MKIEVKLMYGLFEDKGDNVMLLLGQRTTFDEIVKFRKTKAMFRDINRLVIVQALEVEQ